MFNIPAPGAPGISLLQGFETGSNHMARLLQQKIQQQQLAQQQEHFMQNFGLQQAQENRAQQEFPHRLAQLEAETAHKNALAQMWGGFGQNEQMPNQNYNQDYGVGNQAQFVPPQNQQQVQPPSLQQLQQGFSPQGNSVPYEEVIRQGDPGKSQLDRMSGYPGMATKHITQDSNGNLITTYPSGKVTRTKVGPNKEEMAQIESEKARNTEQGKLQVKEKEEIERSLPIAKQTLEDAKRALALMGDKDVAAHGKEWWGAPLIPVLNDKTAMNMRKRGIKDPKFGQLEALYGKLVASGLSQMKNPRLASALNFAIANKPSFLEPYEVAHGKIQESIKTMQKAIKLEEDRLKSLKGNSATANGKTSRVKIGEHEYDIPNNKLDEVMFDKTLGAKFLHENE